MIAPGSLVVMSCTTNVQDVRAGRVRYVRSGQVGIVLLVGLPQGGDLTRAYVAFTCGYDGWCDIYEGKELL